MSLNCLLASGDLPRLQKGFDGFAFAANGHAGKLLEPFAFRLFWLPPQPVRQKPKLIGEYFPAADTIKQMIQQTRR